MKNLRTILTIVGLIVVIGLIAIQLRANKEKMAKNAKIVEKTTSVFPVVITSAKTEEVNTSFNATGNFEPYRELTFVSEAQGRVVSISFDKGYFVSEGQVIARLDDENLQRQLKIAQINLDKSKKDWERQESLWKSNATTEVNVENAKFAYQNAEQQILQLKEQLAKTLVRVPISGTVNRKHIEKGSYLAPATPIADITDVSSLKMIIKVAENEVLKIKEGQRVSIKADVYPGASFTGTVKTIAVKADESKRFAIDIDLQNNAQNPLKAGMYGVASFEFNKIGSLLFIPRKAIVGSLKDAKVYIAKTDNTAELRSLKTGLVKEDKVEVIEGLKEGEKVVVTGQINLQNGVKISIIK
jgi:RND family efflux transporter MFP subunit